MVTNFDTSSRQRDIDLRRLCMYVRPSNGDYVRLSGLNEILTLETITFHSYEELVSIKILGALCKKHIWSLDVSTDNQCLCLKKIKPNWNIVIYYPNCVIVHMTFSWLSTWIYWCGRVTSLNWTYHYLFQCQKLFFMHLYYLMAISFRGY